MVLDRVLIQSTTLPSSHGRPNRGGSWLPLGYILGIPMFSHGSFRPPILITIMTTKLNKEIIFELCELCELCAEKTSCPPVGIEPTSPVDRTGVFDHWTTAADDFTAHYLYI